MTLLPRSITLRRWSLVGLLIVTAIAALCQPAVALIVEDETDTTIAPLGNPYWNNFTISGTILGNKSRDYIYLGDGWALSAYHVGLPDLESDPSDNPEDPDSNDEYLHFSTGSFHRVKNQAYPVKNPCYYAGNCAAAGSTENSDLRLIRINGDPNLPTVPIGSQGFVDDLNPNTNDIEQREVLIFGRGPSRWPFQTHWNATYDADNDPPPPNDVWDATCTTCAYDGYKSDDNDVKRWGKNQIDDERQLFGGGVDASLQGVVNVNGRHTTSLITKFDEQGLDNEAQAVGGDSGSAVFFFRGSAWELVGIVNGAFAPIVPGVSPPTPYDRLPSATTAVYGSFNTFADLSYYHNEIVDNIMLENGFSRNYSIIGDINLDGLVSGNGTGPTSSDDVSAFVAGWLTNSATPDITAWKNGDLSRDGRTDATDFFLLRNALNASGAGSGLTLESLFGDGAVPEPSSLLLAAAGAAMLASGCRRGRRAAGR